MSLVARLRAAGCVFAEDEARLLTATARTPAELEAMAARRVDGTPLEHVLGWAGFGGLRIAVEPGVFVPRRRTELLARTAADVARRLLADRPRLVAVDLCCGAGAVGAALAGKVAHVEVHAVDVDPAAVRCARRNLADLGGSVYTGDLYQPLPSSLRGRVDVLTANAPYVPTAELRLLPSEARLHEPPTALDGGVDGLDVLRGVLAGAADWLAPDGCVLVETSERQAASAVAAARKNGLHARVVRDEDLEATVVVAGATRPFT